MGNLVKILLVEDNADTRRALARGLRLERCEVLTAEDVDAAIVLLEQHEVDAVVTDLLCPGGGGERVLRHVASSARPVPVLLLTGLATHAPAGFAAILEKPLDANPRTILEAIRRTTR